MMEEKDKLPAAVRRVPRKVGGSLTSDQIDDLGKLQDIRERSKHHRTIVNAWRQQQEQDRKMRRQYATWLMVAMSLQSVAINVVFVLIGCGVLKFDQWTTNTFIVSVFAELSTLVLLVVKYLFPSTTDKILDLIDRFRARDSK
jgi:hypothetical protein